MTKKQCGIIFTLLALILCVGMLAAKLNNGGLNDPTDLSQVLSTEKVNEEDTEALNQKIIFMNQEVQENSKIQQQSKL